MKRTPTLAAYRRIYKKTEGWFLWESAAIWDALYRFQASEKITGDLLEIGVWHSKSAALTLLHTDAAKEMLFLVERFPQEQIEAALAAADKGARLHVRLLECDSRNLREIKEIDERKGRFRWIHIDGEHSIEALRNDLEIADRLLADDGIVCLDDFLYWAYPHLTDVTFQYLREHPERFSMFLCGFNKAYLARPSNLRRYQDFCYRDLVSELERQKILCTLIKSSTKAESSAFGVGNRIKGRRFRGLDAEQDRVDY